MNLLENIAVELTYPSCGQKYQVSLQLIATSQQAMHESCPVAESQVRECPQVTFAKLVSDGTLQDLERAWERIEHELTSRGAAIVISAASIAPGHAAHDGKPSEQEIAEAEATEESSPTNNR